VRKGILNCMSRGFNGKGGERSRSRKRKIPLGQIDEPFEKTLSNGSFPKGQRYLESIGNEAESGKGLSHLPPERLRRKRRWKDQVISAAAAVGTHIEKVHPGRIDNKPTKKVFCKRGKRRN